MPRYIDPSKNAWFPQVKDLAVEAQDAQSPVQLQVHNLFTNHGHSKVEQEVNLLDLEL